jgi:outer membrane protein TolC
VCRIIGALIVMLLLPSLPFAAQAQRPAHPGSPEARTQTAPSGVSLSMAEAIERSRQQHPRVVAALMSAEAAGYSAEQVGKWANPEVNFYQEQFSTAPDIDQSILSVSQRIRIGGQLGLASDAGQALRGAAQAEAGATQEQLTLLVQQTYAQLHRVQESLLAVEVAQTSVGDLVRDLEARLQEGDVAPFDLARMRIENESLRAQEGKLEAEQRVGWQRLGFLTSSPVPESGWVFEEPSVPSAEKGPSQEPSSERRLPDVGQRVRDAQHSGEGKSASEPRVAIKKRHDVNAAALRIDAATARAEAEGREAVPDLLVSLGYTRLDPGINGFVWGVSASIPIFNSNGASKAAQLAKAQSLTREYDALVQEAESDARGAWQEYRKLSQTLQELREVAGQRRGILPIARIAYEEGEITVTGLLDAERAELDAALRELELGHLEADAWFRWRYASGQYLGGEEQQ